MVFAEWNEFLMMQDEAFQTRCRSLTEVKLFYDFFVAQA